MNKAPTLVYALKQENQGYFFFPFDTQFHLHWLPLVDISER